MPDLNLREQAVWDEIIGPMTALYTLPKGKTEADVDSMLAQYVHELKRFNQDELRRGYTAVRADWKNGWYPPIPVFTTACSIAKRSKTQNNPNFNHDYDFAANVSEKARLYTEEFMTGGLGRQAVQEQWDHWLRDYVKHIALFQAQALCKAEQTGSPTLQTNQDPWHRKNFQIEAFERAGGICVEVPSDLIENWRRSAAWILENGGWDRVIHGRFRAHPAMPAGAPVAAARPRVRSPGPEDTSEGGVIPPAPPVDAYEDSFDPI